MNLFTGHFTIEGGCKLTELIECEKSFSLRVKSTKNVLNIKKVFIDEGFDGYYKLFAGVKQSLALIFL